MVVDVTQLFWMISIFVVLLLVMGFYCVTVTYNLLRVLIGLEIVIKAATLLVITVGYLSGQMALAQAIVITVIVIEVVVMVAAAGIVLGFFHEYDSLDVRQARSMKG